MSQSDFPRPRSIELEVLREWVIQLMILACVLIIPVWLVVAVWWLANVSLS
jgi:hypothetical protein